MLQGYWLRSAARGEEALKQGDTLLLQDAADHLRAVVESGLGEDVDDAPRGACLWVASAEDDRGDASEDDRARAHGAWLERHVEGRVRQPPAAERLGGAADREDLGMRGGVAAQLALVAGCREKLAIAGDDGADRHIAMTFCLAGSLDRQAHQALLCVIADPVWHSIREYGTDNFASEPVLNRMLAQCRDSASRDDRRMIRRLPILTAVVLLTSAAATTSAGASTGVSRAREFVPHQVVLKLEGQSSGRAVDLPPGVGVRSAAAALRSSSRVVYAAPNYIATASDKASTPVPESELPNDPGPIANPSTPPGGWVSLQWNFLPWEATGSPLLPASAGGIDAVGAWRNLIAAKRRGAHGVTIAVLDTGIAYRNKGSQFRISPDFASGQFVKGYDFVDDDHLPLDENGHGTHVAGTIAEKTNNGIGLVGLAYRAKLMPVRVLDRDGSGQADEIARGIHFAVAHGADVINMSFNFACGKSVPSIDEELRRAYRRGVVTVASVGNLGSESCVSPPATGPRTIGVGGTTEGGCLGSYSLLSGEGVDLVAPGGGPPAPGCLSVSSRPIYQVTFRGGNTRRFGEPAYYIGTSMAAAHVSGVAAMILASGVLSPNASPRGTVNELTRRLRKTARDLGLPAGLQGAGLIDAGKATDPST